MGLFKLLGIVVFISLILSLTQYPLLAYALMIFANGIAFAIVLNNIFVILSIVAEKFKFKRS